QYTLFGRQTPMPAITTVFLDTGSGHGDTEVGVAILPGGIDGPPNGVTQTPDSYSDSTGGYCKRATGAGNPSASGPLYTTSRSWYNFNPTGTSYTPRPYVRKWGATCQSGVPGRSVSVVRLDTGEVLRVFARNGTVANVPAFNEAPHALTTK